MFKKFVSESLGDVLKGKSDDEIFKNITIEKFQKAVFHIPYGVSPSIYLKGVDKLGPERLNGLLLMYSIRDFKDEKSKIENEILKEFRSINKLPDNFFSLETFEKLKLLSDKSLQTKFKKQLFNRIESTPNDYLNSGYLEFLIQIPMYFQEISKMFDEKETKTYPPKFQEIVDNLKSFGYHPYVRYYDPEEFIKKEYSMRGQPINWDIGGWLKLKSKPYLESVGNHWNDSSFDENPSINSSFSATQFKNGELSFHVSVSLDGTWPGIKEDEDGDKETYYSERYEVNDSNLKSTMKKALNLAEQFTTVRIDELKHYSDNW